MSVEIKNETVAYSPMQLKILSMIAQDAIYPAIAERLGLSQDSVVRRVRRIKDQLGQENTVLGAIKYAYQTDQLADIDLLPENFDPHGIAALTDIESTFLKHIIETEDTSVWQRVNFFIDISRRNMRIPIQDMIRNISGKLFNGSTDHRLLSCAVAYFVATSQESLFSNPHRTRVLDYSEPSDTSVEEIGEPEDPILLPQSDEEILRAMRRLEDGEPGILIDLVPIGTAKGRKMVINKPRILAVGGSDFSRMLSQIATAASPQERRGMQNIATACLGKLDENLKIPAFLDIGIVTNRDPKTRIPTQWIWRVYLLDASSYRSYHEALCAFFAGKLSQ